MGGEQMKRECGQAIGILLVLLTAVAAIQSFALFRLSARIAKIESGGSVGGEVGPITPLALSGEVKSLSARVDSIGRVQGALRTDVERLSDTAAAAAEKAARPDAAPAGDGAAPLAGSTEKLKQAVEKLVDEKLAKLPQRTDGEWKPALEEMAKKLGLTDLQKTQVKRILDDGKHEVFNLVSRKRPDGTALIDDLVLAVQDPIDPQTAMKQWFTRLFSEKIPGRDEPYISEILRIKQDTEKSLTGVLDGKQAEKMKGLTIDYLGVKTGYDPFAEYVKDSLR
jgi:hypothetical protein